MEWKNEWPDYSLYVCSIDCLTELPHIWLTAKHTSQKIKRHTNDSDDMIERITNQRVRKIQVRLPKESNYGEWVNQPVFRLKYVIHEKHSV